jgi:multiple sugar transport system permease protein
VVRRHPLTSAALYGALFALAVAFLFPFYWLVRSSLMTNGEIFSMPMLWLPRAPRIENYVKAFTSAPFVLYFRNTLFLVAVNVVANVASSSFVAFGFARIEFTGKGFWFAMILSTLMIPTTVVLIPQFMEWKLVGAYNTFWPLTLPAFFGNAFYVFLIRQFFMAIPRDYDEAAFMDGASYLSIYRGIIIPMSRPALVTAAVFTFMFIWNDFFGPLIYLSDRTKLTLALGLQSFLGQYLSKWNLLMAASAVVVLPMIVMYFFAQRFFIEGITLSGLKG